MKTNIFLVTSTLGLLFSSIVLADCKVETINPFTGVVHRICANAPIGRSCDLLGETWFKKYLYRGQVQDCSEQALNAGYSYYEITSGTLKYVDLNKGIGSYGTHACWGCRE